MRRDNKGRYYNIPIPICCHPQPLNVFTWGGLILIVFGFFLIVLIAFTPLREFIPGYADINTRKMATYAAFRTDSLERVLQENQVYLDNIKFVLSFSNLASIVGINSKLR